MAWFDTVKRNVQWAGETIDGEVGSRDALLGLWLALDIVPENHLDSYSSFDEASLEADAQAMELAEVFAPVQDPGTKASAIRALIRDLAVRIRALELHVHELNDGSRPRTASGNLASFDGFQAYLVLLPPKSRTAKDKQSFRLRGLARSRLIPVSLNDYQVELVVARDPRGRLRRRDAKQLLLGAGLFEGLKFVEETSGDGFIIRDAVAPGQLDVIQRQLDAAGNSQCAGVVYPELTISELTLATMSASIRDGSWDTQSLSMIVAGSRHRTIDGGTYNIATILDGYGEEITEHRKLYSYSDDGVFEAIDLGSKLHVVLLEDTLFAFGICLDYCNPRLAPPYLTLDVDFILVPSCGEDKTMLNHIERSSDTMKNLRTRTLVVQQYYHPRPPADHPLGYVLARAERSVPELKDVATMQPWHVKSL